MDSIVNLSGNILWYHVFLIIGIGLLSYLIITIISRLFFLIDEEMWEG